jgi:hypothetical protein
MVRNNTLLLVIFSLLFFITSCSNSAIKPIENALDIGFIVIEDGIAVNSGTLTRDDKKKILDLHNNAIFISEVKVNPLVETVPMDEELSNSNIRIHISPQRNVYIVYNEDSIFKVIHEDERIAYNIKSAELLEFIKENKE